MMMPGGGLGRKLYDGFDVVTGRDTSQQRAQQDLGRHVERFTRGQRLAARIECLSQRNRRIEKAIAQSVARYPFHFVGGRGRALVHYQETIRAEPFMTVAMVPNAVAQAVRASGENDGPSMHSKVDNKAAPTAS